MTAGHPVELEPLFGDYPLDQAFDEMREPGGEVRPPYRALGRDAGQPARRRVATAQAVGRSGLPHPGHHLHRVRPRRRNGTHLPLRSAAPPGDRRGVGPHRARPHPAHHRAESLSPRRLLRCQNPRRPHRPPRAGLQLQALPAADARIAGAAQRLHRGRRLRSAAPLDRRVRGPRRQLCACPRA